MTSSKESFYSVYEYLGPPIPMGDNSTVQATRQERVQFKDGSFENIYHIPRLFVNLTSMYQMTHIDTGRNLEFTSCSMRIYDMQTNLKFTPNKVNDQSRM